MSRNGTSNEVDLMIILAELEFNRKKEFGQAYGGVGTLYKADVTCTGFINSNPNDQIRYALENNLFPIGID